MMTVADETSTQNTKPAKRRLSRRTIAIIATAVVVIAGAVTVTSVTAAKANADEIARECTTALKAGTAAAPKIPLALDVANKALEKVKSVDLPGGEGWKSTSYAAHPGTAAVEAIPAKDGAAAVPAKPVRHSGAWMTNAVIVDRDALGKIKIATECTTREEAAKITASAKKVITGVDTLTSDVKALLADFTTFQADEHARVAAEVAAEAARKAAEEAARKAAEEAAAAEAARQAAAAEAARQASGGSSGGSSSGGSRSGGGSSGGSSGGGGGGSVGGGGGGLGGGVGSGGGGCKTSNGMGGTTNC
jgi:colicin import membrane protein